MTSLVHATKRVAPQWMKESVRSGYRALGSLTQDQRPLPEFLIIGTKRGGTTSLWRYLLEHPAVLPLYPAAENVKSPHYFDIHWDKGEAWYRSHMPSRAQRARHGRRTGHATIVGEASPYYMYHPAVAERVAQTSPEMKIIALLRDPVERAFSHYKERRKNRTETLSFREALQAEPARLAAETEEALAQPGYYSPTHDFCSYLSRGRYAEQLDRWANLFPADQLLVLRSEDMYRDPTRITRDVHRFLGIPELDLDNPQTFNAVPSPDMPEADRLWLRQYYGPYGSGLAARFGSHLTWD